MATQQIGSATSTCPLSQVSTVVVRRDQPAVRLRLFRHRYDERLLGRDDAQDLAAALRARVRSRPPA